MIKKSKGVIIVKTKKEKIMLKKQIIEKSIIPEKIRVSSSEEKKFAKECDIVISNGFEVLGYEKEIFTTRSNSADAKIWNNDHSAVIDSKASRCRRNPYNPKDFKIYSVDKWRMEHKHAIIIAPWHTFSSSKNSQIYNHAKECNVTLLTYGRFCFLVNEYTGQEDLKHIWEINNYLKIRKCNNFYWDELDKSICDVYGKSKETLKKYKNEEINYFIEQSNLAIKIIDNDINALGRIKRNLLRAKKELI